VDVTLERTTHGVDTGFLVFNHAPTRTWCQLFAELGVDTAPSDMSFSVQVPGREPQCAGMERLQPQHRVRPAPQPAAPALPAHAGRPAALQQAGHGRWPSAGQEAALAEPIGDFLDREGFSNAFRDWYFLPMIGCIWSCPTDQMLRFPIATMIRFCHNHGLIQVTDRPQWHTVRGGSKHYVASCCRASRRAR
jgi:predicted NAD/FAD-binding protein